MIDVILGENIFEHLFCKNCLCMSVRVRTCVCGGVIFMYRLYMSVSMQSGIIAFNLISVSSHRFTLYTK